MAKAARRYQCQECGFQAPYESGKCPACGAWGSMEEMAPEVKASRGSSGATTGPVRLSSEQIISIQPPQRIQSGIGELDRVLGGGFVPGGVTLLGGQPGIGKSTLLLQVCGAMAKRGQKVLYISGEESASQIGLRAQRLEVLHQGLEICPHTAIEPSLALADDHALVVVDSAQAMKAEEESGWPGSITQVRAVAQKCVDFAKSRAVPVVLVGHITKEGRLAGPMVLEHMVDTVMTFSGESSSLYRTLRASKNRYGDTDELGIFEMGRQGLVQVPDPSYLYWNREDSAVSGVAMTVLMEGSRPLVAEIQALAGTSAFAYPKRAGMGVSPNRLQLLLAVLEGRCGLNSSKLDLYCNVAGGLEARDPAADLAIAMSLAGAMNNLPIGPDTCLIGEVGLAGELRPVPALASRLKEAKRLGFRRAVVSAREQKVSVDLDLIQCSTLKEAMKKLSLI